MVISHISRLMARHGRLAFLIIGILVIFPFVVLWRTPGRRFADVLRGQPSALRMYGETWTDAEFVRELRESDVAVFLQTNGFILPSRDNRLYDYWLEQTLYRIRALREARRRGLDAVSDEQVAERIRSMPFFQVKGEFDPERFRQFCNGFLRSQGLTATDLDEIVRKNIIIERLENLVRASVFASPREVRTLFDVRREKIHLRRRDFRYFDLMKEASIDPSEQEIKDWFAKHRTEIRLPERKRIRVAKFDPKQFQKDVKITPKEVQDHYRRNKVRFDRMGKNSFEKAKTAAESELRAQKARRKALETARNIRSAVLAAWNKNGKKGPAADLFARECNKAGVKTVDSGFFSERSTEIPGVGKLPNLIRRTKTLSADDPLSNVLFDSGAYYLACFLEAKEGPIPDKLDAETRAVVIDKIIEEKARAFYDEHVEKFRKMLENGKKTPQDLIREYAEEVERTAGKSDEEKQELKRAFQDEVTRYLIPYFVPEKKKALVAVFSPRRYAGRVKISDEDVREYYEKHKSEFKTNQARFRKIVLRIPKGAKPEDKQKLRKKLEKVRAEIAAGLDFAEAAGKYSEDARTRAKGGDAGFLTKTDLPKEIRDLAFRLEPGEISDVLETPTEFLLLKMEEKRDVKPLAEAAPVIRKKLLEAEQKRMAQEAASKFLDAVYNALDNLPDDPKKTAADIFRETAAKTGVIVKETDWFRKGGLISPFGFESALSQKAFDLNKQRPVSDIIEGREDIYVACWKGTQKAYLPKFGKEPDLLVRVRNHLKREAALRLARTKAREMYEELQKKLAAGTPFVKAAEGLGFEDVPEFPIEDPPRKGAFMDLIVKHVRSVPAGTLATPIETPYGAVLVYVESRTPPTDEEFEKEKDAFRQRILAEKEQEILAQFRKRLEEESKTELAEKWRPGQRRGSRPRI